MNKYIIRGICVAFNDNEPHTQQEAEAYLQHALSKNKHLTSLLIKRDGDYADLNYTIEAPPFERIRRITGYLVGTTDRFNDAKRAEERDRVKHTLDTTGEEN